MLYHFSENPAIPVFEPRKLDYRPDEPAMVWAIDEFHAAHYFFPRDCPRVCIWPKEDTADRDIERFFGHSSTDRVIAVETGWLARIRETRLYRYSFSPNDFTLYSADAGYYTSLHSVEPVKVDPMGDLLSKLGEEDIELRITPSLMPLRNAILTSTVNFSMIRMKNAKQ
ncbi:DUF6886 family protein [Paenibacillus sp. MBLB4367]|uniref:DUF6886 family protein n=1 Tax=Paenibacillus sp. MBLB4367 TaxID=3384767 RepID=UPI003907E7F1